MGAQSITSGGVAGTVTDPSGAAVPGAPVSLISTATGTSNQTTTDSKGDYRFAFTPPGTYTVEVSAPGFKPQRKEGIVVSAGEPTPANFELVLAGASATVTVSEHADVLQTENADNATVYNSQQITDLPNPGNDLTYVAQTAPGVTMNTQGGYGNFSANGMPATSNLFAINGMNFNDPYLNLNNSGASNLMLGSNDIAEANVINNAYSGQYGQYAGSQVSYVTKSGTNSFHGDGVYMWNGRALNANDFFDNAAGNPRAFLNFNQWQTGAQGPIWKNHTFFDVDYEGARVVLPTSPQPTLIPSMAFQNATLANLLTNGNSAEIPFYQQMFKIFNGSPSSAGATPVAGGGCGTYTPQQFGLAPGTPCATQFTATAPNRLKETQWSGRVDHVFNDRDRGYIRVWRDNGFQPSYTDGFGPNFNAQSNQPQMALQVSESHTLSPTAVNQFNGSSLFYSASFVNSNPTAEQAALPFPVSFSGSFFGYPQVLLGNPNATIGGASWDFNQGRRVWQYQILDDFSKISGAHTFRAGFSWLHDNVTELGFGEELNGWLTINSMMDFYQGFGSNSTFAQKFPSSTEQPFRFNTFGGYVADDWKVKDNLTVSANLRLESYSNPTCDHDCFARLASVFTGAPGNLSQPYNQAILFNQHNAYPNTQAIVWEPRLGIAWKPGGADSKTVIRTGAGIFADEIAGQYAQYAAFNAPELLSFTVAGSNLPAGTGTFAPGAPGSLATAASNANAAFRNGFASGATLAALQASTPGFVPPTLANFPAKFLQPTYYKWNFEIQRDLGWNTVLDLNYSGMRGIHVPIADSAVNAYCPPVANSPCPSGFAGLPATAPDARFGAITQYLPAGYSSYNGLTVSLQRKLSKALSWNLNYTWSHALDVVSNGGNEQFSLGTNISLLTPQNPYNIRANYGSADQDVRHYLSAGWVLSDTFRHAGFKWGPNAIFGGWTLSSNLFFRTGLPFTIVDNAFSGALSGFNYGTSPGTATAASVFATQIAPAQTSCTNAVNTPCFSTSSFLPFGTETGFGNVGRNSYRGPNFFDMDLALSKEVAITERLRFIFGAQAFNALNHPNFDQPVADVSNTGQFGLSTRAVGPPTSILGAFVGGNDSQRFVEIKGTFRF